MLTSSSRREARSENRKAAKRTGCMSSIFHLFHRHHHSHKRLPSAGKKDGKKDKAVISPTKPTPPPEKRPQPENDAGERREPKRAATPEKSSSVGDLRRHSCDAPRSPTIPSEIRRVSSVGSPDSPRRPAALVARLMGLDDSPVSTPVSAAEKRRKLLGALEKCDDDLKALKRIIDAVRLAESRRKSVGAVGSVEPVKGCAVKGGGDLEDLDGGDQKMEEKKCWEVNGEQPSPVSVLDAISSPSRYRSSRPGKGNQTGGSITSARSWIVETSRMAPFLLGDYCCKEMKSTNVNRSLNRSTVIEGLPRVSSREGENIWDQLGLARKRMDGGGRRRQQRRSSSTAMVESVGEVWEDGVWEERWELGRVGVGLEGDIFGDLVEEIVKELLGCYYYYYKLSLPLGFCRKRLCF